MTHFAAVRSAALVGRGLRFGAKPQHLPGFCCGLAPIDDPRPATHPTHPKER